jgi:hypothetical protein
MNLRESKEWERGRIGEILQMFVYLDYGVRIQDLADRTEKRAPLLRGRDCSIISPDTTAIKTAEFFLEFKTKTIHLEWNGGGRNAEKPHPPRSEQGIDRRLWLAYQMAEKDWRKPLVLSILCLQSCEIIAATLQQLGEPRFSPNEGYDLVNWAVRRFHQIASFDRERLDRLFNGDDAQVLDIRKRWLEQMPNVNDRTVILEWLRLGDGQFDFLRRFIFDQIEQGWHEK